MIRCWLGTNAKYAKLTELREKKLKYNFASSVFSACFALFHIFIFLCVLCVSVYSQQSGSYLIPRQIYVGDPATLVLPLPAYSHNDDIIITESLPADPHVDLRRIILERRTTGSRLMIEFTAFTTGVIEFPIIEIDGEYFEGLTVNINSLIDRRELVLSAAASVLAMPGTAAILYGALAAIVVIIFLAIWFLFKGRFVIAKLREKWKRQRLFRSIINTEKRLQKAVLKDPNRRKILDTLSDEFREFLSVITENNCRSMTAREFKQMENGPFLAVFFHKCDELRFSGVNIDAREVVKLLDDLRVFVSDLENELNSGQKEEQKSEF